MDVIALALAKKFTTESLLGGGAVKGKNATVKSITPVAGGHEVTFQWTLDDGTVQTGSMLVENGKDGESVALQMPPVTLAAAGWVDNKQTVPVPGVLADESRQAVFPIPVERSREGYHGARITSYVPADGVMEFTAGTVPSENLFLYVALFGVHGQGGPVESTVAWYPAVDGDGNLSWSRVSTSTAPADTNIRGPQGEKGDTGDTGVQGPQGVQGIQGEKGDTGEQGPQGIQGVQGPQGPQGAPGESAASAINPRGDYDPDADPPYTNNDYVTHTDGNTYVCKGDNPTNEPPTTGRADDPYWQLLALQGAQGPQGEQGVQGPQGERGPQGEAGAQGLQGIQGIQGEQGVTFTPSVAPDGTLTWTNDGGLENPEPRSLMGPPGADGADGADGKDAPQIDDTATAADTVWSSSKVDTVKVGYFSNTFVGMTGQAANATVSVGEFLSALAGKYGNKAYINGIWSSSDRGYVTDGNLTVEINGGLLLFAATGAAATPFPNSTWQYAEVTYLPMASTSVADKIYKFVGRVSGTAGTLDMEKIYVFDGHTTADAAKTAITALSGSTFSLGTIADNHYLVRNGVCYFQISVSAGSITGGTQYTIYSGLPKPVAAVDFVVPYYTGSTAATPVRFRVTTAGALQVASGSNTGGGVYVCSGSYPVA